jgi:ABC-type phosphate transport system substrate-binding protein
MNASLRIASLLLACLFANLCAAETSGSEEGRKCLSSIGSVEMATLMDAWATALHEQDRGFCPGHPWKHVGDDAAVGALMFDLADVAPMGRALRAAEVAPYAHQYAGDMMKAPLLVRVGSRHGSPVFIATNKRPDAPLPRKVHDFIAFALSARGQEVASALGFEPLGAQAAAREAIALLGFVAELDAALPVYRATGKVTGAIRSVGSDGMKSLMERWMVDFRAHQPAVTKGERWEHLGTLNGFHALMAGETDLAPMGRELWPDEAEAFARIRFGRVPFEIRVARGGFNTQQRTTAQAVFVNASNPISQITMRQLAAVFGASPAITRWGELGVTGERADHPIHLRIPPRATPNAMSMQFMALHGGRWAESAQEASVAETASAIANDPDALGFGGFEDGGRGVKTVPLALPDGQVVAGTAQSVSSGRYPLSRYMYIRMDRVPGEPLRPQIKEFLRYVLSRQGQEPILYSGYFPLTAQEATEELSKLD